MRIVPHINDIIEVKKNESVVGFHVRMELSILPRSHQYQSENTELCITPLGSDAGGGPLAPISSIISNRGLTADKIYVVANEICTYVSHYYSGTASGVYPQGLSVYVGVPLHSAFRSKEARNLIEKYVSHYKLLKRPIIASRFNEMVNMDTRFGTTTYLQVEIIRDEKYEAVGEWDWADIKLTVMAVDMIEEWIGELNPVPMRIHRSILTAENLSNIIIAFTGRMLASFEHNEMLYSNCLLRRAVASQDEVDSIPHAGTDDKFFKRDLDSSGLIDKFNAWLTNE